MSEGAPKDVSKTGAGITEGIPVFTFRTIRTLEHLEQII